MLTGDNPLTACHVAKELKIATRKTLVLTEADEGVWHWQSVGGGTTAAMATRPAELGKNFDLCLTGDVSEHFIQRRAGSIPSPSPSPSITLTLHPPSSSLQGMAYVLDLDDGKTFDTLLPYVRVFARVAPKQKVCMSLQNSVVLRSSCVR